MKNYFFLSFLFAFLVLEPGYSNCQDFKWRSDIKGVTSDNFYSIQLSPEIISKLNPQLGDIRIFDSKSKEIPYILKTEFPLSYKDYFIEYKIIEKKEQLSWPYFTRIVIHNPTKKNISNIHLIIKNSDVSKSLKLSGSDDNKNWYSIKDNYRFQAMYSDLENSVIKIIDFPVSNYEYYEILIDDWKNNPINVLKAGYFNTSVEKGKYSKVKSPVISQLELKNEKQSLVKLNFTENQLIHKIALAVEGPEFYYRDAELQVQDSTLNKRNKYEYYFRTLANVNISSNTSNTFYFDDLRTNAVFVRINNKDDLPLKIKSVETEQLNHYLICKLSGSEKYHLSFGNKAIASPEYDIKYFFDLIPAELKILNTSEIISTGKVDSKKPSGIFLDKKFIWVAIILVILLLVFMINHMLRDMRSKQMNDKKGS